MNEIHSNPFFSTCLRPSYPLNAERPHVLASCAAALNAGLALLTRTAGARAVQPAFADGFGWLMNLLSNRLATRNAYKGRVSAVQAPLEDPAERRIERLLREAPKSVEL